MKMKKEDREIFLKQIFWEVVGSAFIAGGIYNFAVQAGFPMTGFSGISIILYQLFGVPVGFSTILLNIPVAILCYRLLGRHFFFSSLRCMLISSLMIDYVAPLLPVYSGDRLLAALCTGVFAGLGYAVIYMQNSSTGGSDFIIMAVKNLKPYWSVGKISFVTDVIITDTISAAQKSRAAAPGIPVRDTVKVTADGIITGTPARSTLSAIQTPQVFQADLIKAALTNAMRKHLAITDDCSAVEQLRVKPVVTQGSEENIKITTPIDIELAELILRRGGKA